MTPDIPTYILHYTKNTQRRLFQEHILALEGFTNVTWITDFDRETITYDMFLEHFSAHVVEYMKRRPTAFDPFYPLRGEEISLCMKHKAALSLFWQTSATCCLILEDDVVIQKDFKNQLIEHMVSLPQDWKLAFPGDCNMRIETHLLKPNQAWYLNPVGKAKCSDSILWNRSSAREILQGWANHKICMPSDHEISFWMRVLNWPTYWLEPPICVQGSHIGLFESMQLPHGKYYNPDLKYREDLTEILQKLDIATHINRPL
jgi:hypothetical protein